MNNKKKYTLLFTALLILLILSAFAGIVLGGSDISFKDMLNAVLNKSVHTPAYIILFDLRLPRVTAAILAGAGLAVAGLLLQSATDNDLCSPNVIGVNGGAGFAYMVLLCVLPAAFDFLPLAAFAGALLTTAVVLGMSFPVGHHTSKTTVILAGVAVGALLNAGISFLSQLYPEVLSSYSSFSAGGFSNIYFSDLTVPAVMIFIGIAAAQLLSPALNLLCLGDEMAQSLGIRVRRIRVLSLVAASLLCSAVVSFAGLLGFVGLVVPHIVRRVAGYDIRVLVPSCAFAGGILTVLSDLASRTLFYPAELPAGILLSVLGAPFFLYLLFGRSRKA